MRWYYFPISKKLMRWSLMLTIVWKSTTSQQDECIEFSTHVFKFQYDPSVFTNRFSTIWEYAINSAAPKTRIMTKGSGSATATVYGSYQGRVTETCPDPDNCDDYNAGFILENVTKNDIGIYFALVTQTGGISRTENIQLDVINNEGPQQIIAILEKASIVKLNSDAFNITQQADMQQKIQSLSSPFNLTVDMTEAGCIPLPMVTVSITAGNGITSKECRDVLCTYEIEEDLLTLSVDILDQTYPIYDNTATTVTTTTTETTQTKDTQVTQVITDITLKGPKFEGPLKHWHIAIIVIGGLLVLLVIFIIVYCCCCRKPSKPDNHFPHNNDQNQLNDNQSSKMSAPPDQKHLQGLNNPGFGHGQNGLNTDGPGAGYPPNPGVGQSQHGGVRTVKEVY